MSQERVLQAIKSVANTYKNYQFDIHDDDDIEQEIFLLCYPILDRFDPDTGNSLESFLYKHCFFRMQNFYRDKTRKIPHDENLTIDGEIEDESRTSPYVDCIESIEPYLDHRELQDFYKIMAGGKVPRLRRLALAKKVEDILWRENNE